MYLIAVVVASLLILGGIFWAFVQDFRRVRDEEEAAYWRNLRANPPLVGREHHEEGIEVVSERRVHDWAQDPDYAS